MDAPAAFAGVGLREVADGATVLVAPAGGTPRSGLKPAPRPGEPGLNLRSCFAVAVKKRRRLLGFTQEELAGRAGLHRTYITDIERGARNLSLQSIERLAGALQTPIGELFAGAAAPAETNGRTRGGDAALSVDILLVEDDPDDVALTLQVFRAARMKNQVHIVRDGVEAVEFLFRQGAYARSWTPHRALVVLLDLKLPKLNGVEVLRLVRSDARTMELPVVMLAGSGQEPALAECRQLGCKYCLVKPVGFDQFSTITSHLSLDWRLVGRPQLER